MDNLTQLIKLANVAREQVECVNTKAQLNSYLDRLPSDLEGGCGVASLHLMNLANSRGLRPTFVHGTFRNRWDAHCWIEYYNHVIDLTATQFISCPKVHVVNAKKNREIYRRDFVSRSFVKSEERIKGWALYVPELRELVQ